MLGRKNSVVNRVKLCRRRNFYAGAQDGVKEVEHLFAVDGVVPRNKDEHVAGRDDFFLIAPLLLFRRPQAHDLVGGHERTLDLVHVRADAVEDGRHARAREIEGGFPNRLCPGHFAKEFRGLVLVGRKSNANLAVTDDAFIGARIRPRFGECPA